MIASTKSTARHIQAIWPACAECLNRLLFEREDIVLPSTHENFELDVFPSGGADGLTDLIAVSAVLREAGFRPLRDAEIPTPIPPCTMGTRLRPASVKRRSSMTTPRGIAAMQ